MQDGENSRIHVPVPRLLCSVSLQLKSYRVFLSEMTYDP